MMKILLGSTMVFSLLSSVPAFADSQPAKLVAAAQGSDVTLVAKKGADNTVWFAFKPVENPKPKLDEKKILLMVLGTALNPLGANVWAPIALAGATFDMKWALPTLIYTVVSWPFAWVALWFSWNMGFILGWSCLAIGLAIGWINSMTTMANLNRPEVKLTDK